MEKNSKDFSIQSLIVATLQKQRDVEPKPPSGYWRSSSLGSCLCGAFLARQGKPADEPFDDRTLRVFSVGKTMEQWVLETLRVESYKEGIVLSTQDEMVSKDKTLVGHLDVLLTLDSGKKIIYEFKSCHSRKFWHMVNMKQGADLHHRMQLWSYLWMAGVDEGRIVYISKDDLAIQEYPIFLNDAGLQQLVIGELATLNGAWRTGVPPVPILDPKDWRFKYCRYHRQCLAIAAEHGWKFTPKADNTAGRAGDIKTGKEA